MCGVIFPGQLMLSFKNDLWFTQAFFRPEVDVNMPQTGL